MFFLKNKKIVQTLNFSLVKNLGKNFSVLEILITKDGTSFKSRAVELAILFS